MPTAINNLFGIHEQALIVRAKRAELLAANIANADTPGYKARDIDFKSVMQQVQQPAATMKVTNARHIQTGGDPLNAAMGYRIPNQPSLDGNTVEMHVEQSRFAQNAVDYQASLQFLNSKISSYISALRGE